MEKVNQTERGSQVRLILNHSIQSAVLQQLLSESYLPGCRRSHNLPLVSSVKEREIFVVDAQHIPVPEIELFGGHLQRLGKLYYMLAINVLGTESEGGWPLSQLFATLPPESKYSDILHKINEFHVQDQARPKLSQPNASVEKSRLTVRELETLETLARGHSNTEIATKLHISANTVKNHLYSIFQKIEVDNRTAAVQWAREHLCTGRI